MIDDVSLTVANAELDAVLARQLKEDARRATLARNTRAAMFRVATNGAAFMWPTAKGWDAQ